MAADLAEDRGAASPPAEVSRDALLRELAANFFPGRGGFGGERSFGPPDQVFGRRNQPDVFAQL